ncbi:MAG: TonB-dependent receptor plug domain-containing protein, partial [Gemmatimonadetes bacterium]|nr:TonB-dependent receptor plug domain-containing protein [Gemmatimonadota bacterium]NIS03078.1 TonB-dependent receptor plug domain-containing protein [Gemmatimonadota bacterium]NIT68816.1 TonB-dependent receptor plug domain-containing protein [Gemmatimonadota bacterium]NIV25461.1 TonB-dependent receptor plug domain-containing protein [Gemmatimonadota bacterium]NIY37393.1 TonB-dependent receptor plug domain-containing protein [Gemmatimonadota bacterium]
GSSSLSQLNEPIIYVDGVRVDNAAVNMFGGGQGEPSKLDDINPESIERVEILKGAAAATLYGTEASNGVIQIFTKKGRAGAPRFSFQSEWSAVRMATGRMEPMADFAASAEDIERIRNRWGLDVGLYEPFELDVLPTFFTTGFGQAYSASASGGGEFGTYYASVRWTDEDGPFAADKLFDPIEGMDFSRDWNRRLQTTANLALSPHEKVKISINTLYSEMEHETPDNSNNINIYGVFSSALMTQPRLATADNLYGQPAFATLRENMYQVNRAETNHVAGSMNVNFTPVPQLRLDATFGVDYANDDVSWFRPYRWNVDGYSSSLV